jgi:hypothetical protein
MKTNEYISGVKEVIYRARYFFLVSLAASLYISFKTDAFTGLMLNIVLNSFSGVIGSHEILIDAITKVNKSSKKINEIHFHQLIADTERLAIITQMIRTGIPESEESQKIYGHLNRMVKENSETINAIKLAMNGASL